MNGAAIGQERNWALAAYGLLLIAPGSGGVTALIGAVLAHVRLDGARGGLYESHYRNLILVFWVWLAVVLILLAFAFTGAAGLVVSLLAWPERGFPVDHFLLGTALWSLCGVLVGLWYYWRLLRGLIRVLDDKPY
jgi:uncharacterized membrane protein